MEFTTISLSIISWISLSSKYVSWKCIASSTTSIANMHYLLLPFPQLLPLIPPLTYNYHLYYPITRKTTSIITTTSFKLHNLAILDFFKACRWLISLPLHTTPSQLRTFFMDDTFHYHLTNLNWISFCPFRLPSWLIIVDTIHRTKRVVFRVWDDALSRIKQFDWNLMEFNGIFQNMRDTVMSYKLNNVKNYSLVIFERIISVFIVLV